MELVPFRIQAYLLSLAAIILVGIPGFMVLEGLSFVDALYFCIVTIATVGYGDIHPVTNGGKLLAIIVIVGGVGSFVGLVVNSLETWFNIRDQGIRQRKLNLLVGVFFSDVGTKLLVRFSRIDPSIGEMRKVLIINGAWTDAEFDKVGTQLRAREYHLDLSHADLKELQQFLIQRRDILLRLLENPMLFEQEQFTEVLQALFHLTDELDHRGDVKDLPETDIAHLANDMVRTYRLLVIEWLEYMKYLRVIYPYLFSLAMRTNPFDTGASPIVGKG
ncbi:MAG: potassium channel family protein [Methanomicrobiales archaeon]|nr:potassium channel family protein [Methanomicrobiales archaeon]